jgi:uncharacterized protein
MRRFATTMTALTLVCVSAAANAGEYAPLSCKKANSPAEHTICDSYSLGQSEARMATLFGVTTSLVAMGQRGNIQDDQRKWLQSRDACGKSIPCLTEAYERRIREFESVLAGIASRGPY